MLSDPVGQKIDTLNEPKKNGMAKSVAYKIGQDEAHAGANLDRIPS